MQAVCSTTGIKAGAAAAPAANNVIDLMFLFENSLDFAKFLYLGSDESLFRLRSQKYLFVGL